MSEPAGALAPAAVWGQGPAVAAEWEPEARAVAWAQVREPAEVSVLVPEEAVVPVGEQASAPERAAVGAAAALEPARGSSPLARPSPHCHRSRSLRSSA